MEIVMNTERLTLEVQSREPGLKGPSRRVRVAGLVPGVIYGSGSAPRSISVEPKLLEIALRSEFGFNYAFQVKLDDEATTRLCMLKARQFDPVRRVITHIDLLNVSEEREVEIRGPVKPVGRSAGERAGGRLQVVTRDVLLRCKVKDIPAAVEHDVTAAGLGESIYIDQITAPAGCEFVYKNRFPVMLVARKRGATDDTEK
jgi:large subunit ribosomal protein L25